ncbi:hypothetical protein F2Q70_00017123 [Brassica cretica]|uniref:Uncharacterized protein n=1 Tax=Brassica cretica TaxID=69181 RepID=A0A8S9I3J2_BRACR|nr:hypothetical protein F2Q70_00017123 [Brassica cretica]KAF2596978.1 hypothetical protein F2Q68_00010073 [Brassica cretica]
MVYEGDIYLGDVYELEKGLRPICRAFVMLYGECSGVDFGAPGASLTKLLSKFSPLLLPFLFQVRLMLVSFCQRRHGILMTHCFGLVAGNKCHDIADHLSYAGSGCQKWYKSHVRLSSPNLEGQSGLKPI